MMNHLRKTLLGFTLIELAIVLIIIGLVVAGVVSGRDLIKSSQIQSTAKEFINMRTSIDLFKGKYDCLPGDCTKAVAYGLGSLDGDGNGILSSSSERGRFFRHLGASGVFDYKPFDGYTQGAHISKYNDQGNYYANVSILYAKFRGNIVGYGTSSSFSSFPTALLNSIDSTLIDEKIDDGDPDSGWVLLVGNSTCVTGDMSAQDVDVIISETELTCLIYLVINHYSSYP